MFPWKQAPSQLSRMSVFSHSYSPGGEEWGKVCSLWDRAGEKFIHRETHGTYNQMNRDFKYF